MSGIGTDPEETGGPERAVQEARRAIYELLTPLPAWTADVVRDEVRRLERAVEARTREQVAREIETADSPAPWRLTSGNVNRAWIDSRDSVKAAHIARNGPEEQQ